MFELAEEAAGFGVWERNLVSEMTLLSAGAAALSGYPPVATQKSVDELVLMIHPDDRGNGDILSAVQERRSFHAEFRVRQPDGSYRWRRNRGRVESINGRPVKMVGAISDIHEEKLMLERLAEAAARKSLAEDVAGFGVWELDAKHGMMTLGPISFEGTNPIVKLLQIVFSPWVFLGLCTFDISTCSHLYVLSKVELSFAYPFLSLAYVAVALFAYFVFREDLNAWRIAGIGFICVGTILIAQGGSGQAAASPSEEPIQTSELAR